MYDEAFSGMTNCRPAQLTGRDQSGHHLYVLRIDYIAAGLTRTELMLKLKEDGVGTQVHYIPVPAQPYYHRLGYRPEDYLNAQQYYQEALSIPLFYDLTDEQQELIVSVLKKLLT